jgi:hypothetical protein
MINYIRFSTQAMVYNFYYLLSNCCGVGVDMGSVEAVVSIIEAIGKY